MICRTEIVSQKPWLLAILLVSLLFVRLSNADVFSVRILRSSQRWVNLGRFGFLEGGFVELNVSHFAIYSPEGAVNPDTYSMGFMLVPESDVDEVEQAPGAATCPLMNPNATKLFSVMDMELPGGGGERPPKAVAMTVPHAGWFSVYLINCAPTRLLSFTAELRTYNVGDNSNRYYLPAGRLYLAIVELVCALLYLVCLFVWLSHVLKVWCTSIAPPPFHIYLTLLLPLLVSLLAASASAMFTRQVQGASPVWDVVVDILLLLSSVTFLAAFYTGLDRVDPYLSDLEKAVLYIGITLWVITSTSLAVLEASPFLIEFTFSYPTLHDTLRTVRFFALGLLAVLLFFVFLSVACWYCLTRRKAHKERRHDDREVDSPFTKFYVLACSYLLIISGITFALDMFLPVYLSWVGEAVSQVAFLVFIVLTLYKLRPRLEKSVYQLFDENDDLDEELADL